MVSAGPQGKCDRESMTRAGRISFALISLLLVAGTVYYWSPWSAPTQETGKGKGKGKGKGTRPDEPASVLVIAARAGDIPVYLDGVGTAKALNTVTVRAQVDGKLIAISFTEGLDVVKGDILAKIDPTLYQAQYDQAVAKKAQDEATLANARLDLERYTKLAASNAVNKQQLDTQRALVAQLEAQVKADQAMIDNARAILGYTNIVAPLSGRTGIRLVDEGNIVKASDLTGIVVITQLRPITVTFNLPQQELPKLNRVLDQGHVPIDAIGVATAPVERNKVPILDSGKVLVVDNQVDQTTGTVKLKAEFPNEKLQLWPGQFINVRVLIETLKNVVYVPTAALQRRSGENNQVIAYVYVVGSDEKAHVRDVEVSLQDDERTVIKSGLKAGENVVTRGFGNLRDDYPVTIGTTEDGSKGGKGKGKGRRVQTSGE
jgi:multidrug efflux system membrane fusion protein